VKTARKTFLRSASLIRPPPRLKISEWAEREAWIPPEGNAEPGKYRLSRMPHQAAMLDDPQDPAVREIFWMMASQFSGKTLCLILICEYVIQVLRRSLIMSRDTKERAREWVQDKFLPTVEATPCMRGLLKDPRKRDSKSTSLNRRFDGGSFKVLGAKSPGGLRATTAGIILQDEIDAYQTTKEGDPCALIDRAAKTFTDAWKIKVSTTTLLGFSRIHAGFLSGDQQLYFVPCVCCGAMQALKFEQVKFTFTAEEAARYGGNIGDAVERVPTCNPNDYTWEIGDFPIYRTKDAMYVCEVCHRGWSDHDRIRAYLSGHTEHPAVVVDGRALRARWTATAGFAGVRSRALSGMYATIGLEKGFANYLHQFAEQFLAAVKGGRETLMAWTNMFKNEPFEEPGEKVEWAPIKKRAEDYDPDVEIPAQVVWVCFGGDVHPDRVEFLFWGWGDGQEVWCLSHQVLFGDFDMPSCQERVWDYLTNKRFTHPVLGPMAWSAGGIDSGHQTKVKAVYQFCSKHRIANVFSLKGFEELGGAVYERKTERVYGGVRLNLNTDFFKTLIFDRLRNAVPGPRFIHFPKERGGQFGDLFYGQLCSEKRVMVKGQWRWLKASSSTRNEVLDMTVYAHGVAEVCRQQEWIARKWKEVREKLVELNLPLPGSRSQDAGAEAARAAVKAALVMGPREKKVPGVERRAPARKFVPRKKIRINSPFRGRFGG
jgi:phage terminase large subunit GpA-like protein